MTNQHGKNTEGKSKYYTNVGLPDVPFFGLFVPRPGGTFPGTPFVPFFSMAGCGLHEITAGTVEKP